MSSIAWLYKKSGEFLKDAVYAANDGIITTFAVVAGVAGASLDPLVILILGFANVFADGISMATGNYLGTKSEKDLYEKERVRYKRFLEEDRDGHRELTRKFLREKGYAEGSDLEEFTELMTRHEEFGLDFIMREELGLIEQKKARPLQGALVTLVAFMIAGLIPLIPYIFFAGSKHAFSYASLFTGAALFSVGCVRGVFFKAGSWLFAGLEMLLVGGLAAFVAYGVGFAISKLA